jgi:LmbE family N-acetylglucosaminyl deacetylase
MIRLCLARPSDRALHVLCLGAHSDDIEIGCGGTILRIIGEYQPLKVTWIILGATGSRAEEASRSAEDFLGQVAEKRVAIEGFRDGFFPYHGAEIKEYFESLKQSERPDLIFTHCRDDLHQDHRLVCELTWNTFRDHLILEYEIPKYDGDLGSPNFFVYLDEAVGKRKVASILENFESQRSKDWFTEDLFFSLLRLRGMEARSPGRYAEGFYCRKMAL